MWFTDTPWPPVLICVVVGVILFLVWSSNKRGMFLLGAAGMIVVAVAIFVVERLIVTEAERIEANVYTFAAAVEADDVDRAMSYISARDDSSRSKIGMAMSLYDIGDDMRITDVQVEMKAANSIGTSHFRANGTISGKGSGIELHGATRWLLTWNREEGEWKITDVKRLHPLKDESMKMLDRIGN